MGRETAMLGMRIALLRAGYSLGNVTLMVAFAFGLLERVPFKLLHLLIIASAMSQLNLRATCEEPALNSWA